MQALVVYDSKFGQTAKVAKAIGTALEGRFVVRVLPVSEASDHWPDALELLIVGGPTHKHGASDELRAFLDNLSHKTLLGIFAAAFDTRYHMHKLLSGSAASIIARRLTSAGCLVLAKPESFFVTERAGPLEDGELERARAWAQGLVAALPQAATTA